MRVSGGAAVPALRGPDYLVLIWRSIGQHGTRLNMKKILPIIIVVIAVLAAFAVYYFFLRPDPDATPATPTRYEELEELVPWVPGEYFVTNINGSGALLKMSISLLLSEDQSEFLGNHVAIVRNAVIKVLMSHPEEELRAPSSIGMLEAEMTNAVREATGLTEEILRNVYISDYVIQ